MTENAPSFPSSLRKKYGSKLANEVDSFPNYFKDASEIIGKPSAIFFAESEIDIIEIITDLVLSLERLKKLEVDPERKLAFCGPGVITIDLMKQAEKHNLFYPPDPASYDESTLGGNVAECAGGLHCKKYGVTKDYIIGLRGITAGGEIIKTGIYSEGDLFNLSGIMIGSEGMLIAITEIAVRLIDRPQPGLT
ncbi:MAG: FAD-binding protein, partial [candidate division Zixibacteria bacterium]|nr:FAD-binding protein [candidate division Zixibacteria bacterium]